MRKATLTLAILSVVVLLSTLSIPARALDRATRLSVLSSVVQVSLVKIQGGQVYYLPWGSGTIISSDGLILTNCHVADPVRFGFSADEVPDYDYLGIALTVSSDQPPRLSYLAEVVQADPYLDLAVVRVARTTDQKLVKAETLNLPYAEVGDSDLLEVGDDVNIFGYPGIGGDTVTFTRGVVSGFTSDASIKGRAWIKTDASIAGGNSGGTAVDEQGLLVGVPTRAGVGGGTEPVDCRPVKDTNGDGRIDDGDVCVPVGGFINALRPVNLARPLIEAARLGLKDTGRRGPAESEVPRQGDAVLRNLFFSSGVNEFNQPTRVVTSLPSGTRSLYLFFDYENMDSSMTVEMKVFIDGQERQDWGLPAAPWRGYRQGMWWIGWADAPFVDGTYRMVLSVDGKEQASAGISIGGAPKSNPFFSDIRLRQAGATEPAVLFPEGLTEIQAVFNYENMNSGLSWGRSWEADGEEVARKDDVWRGAKAGSTSVSLTNQRGFEPGAYRLSLYIDGVLAGLSNFWVTASEGTGPSFDPITFASGIDGRGRPVKAAEVFGSGLQELHAFSTYHGMEDGVNFIVRWYIDQENVLEDPYPWDGGESGDWHYYIYSGSGALPDGEYLVELEVEGEVLRTGTARIGAGARPTPVPSAPKDGVQLQGYILDLDTRRPIPGAAFLVLQPGITLQTFQWTDDEVYAAAEADQRGFFKLPLLLQRGECYTMIIGAAGYWPYGEDGVCITEDDPSLLELTVQIERK